MKRVLKRLAWLCFIASIVAVPAVGAENSLPSLDVGVDQLANRLTDTIAKRYFDLEKRPVIKVALFDFTNADGDITVGSRYVSNRIKLAFAAGQQFELLPVSAFEEKGFLITDKTFKENSALKGRVVGELKADAYVFGRIGDSGISTAQCDISVYWTKPPFDEYSVLVQPGEEGAPSEIPASSSWALNLTPSGLRYFDHVLVAGAKKARAVAKRKDLAEVVFLTQPMCDDLNLSWQVRSDGMIYDVRKRRDAGSLRNRTGQIMQSRVKSAAALKELSFVIKNFGLVIREGGGEAYPLEPYIIPKESQYYFMPYIKGKNGLRFIYLWNQRGKSRKPSSRETGKGWNFFMAEKDWPNIMPVGIHTATATLEPIAETDYGTKRARSEYVTRFKFAVRPGLNIYVVNFVYRRDRPEIFVRRLEIEGTMDQPVKAVKRIKEVYEVYGATGQASGAGGH